MSELRSDHTNTQSDTRTQRGTIMLVALVVLAVLASIIMLFSNSDAAMKIAVLAALWAAFLGLFLVARYRKLVDEERARSESHRLQIENDLRREHDELLQSAPAAPADSMDTELLQEIRSQLTEIREQLEELSGREFGYEPAALRAEARRIQEIEAAAADVDKPATAETEAVILPEEVEPLAETAAPSVEDTAEIPVADRAGKKRFNTGSFGAVKLDVAGEPAPEEEKGRHGRRRRDENAGGVSVAELLANLKKN